MEPDYKSYTLADLQDICEHIDKYKHPERYKKLLAALDYRNALKPAHVEIDNTELSFFQFPKRSTKMKIFTSSILFLGIIAFLYYGVIPWRGREELITPDKEPILFWFFILILTLVAIMQLFTIESKNKK